MKIHLCLVSAQAAANLLPALDKHHRPDAVVLITTASMQSQADNLAAVFRENGLQVSAIKLENEHDFEHMEETLMGFATEHEDDEILLNLTGGTKLMALAAQSVADEAQWQKFYVDADTDQITLLGRKSRSTSQALSEQLRLRHYLRGYGFDLSGKSEPFNPNHQQQSLMSTLVLQIGSLESPLAQLNWLAQQAEDQRKLDVTMAPTQQDSRSLEALLRQFSDAGMLVVSGATIRFPNQAALRFVKGGWLEQHVFQQVASVSGELHIRDKAANLEVTDSAGVKNEMDVAFMARNRLFVLECKTARMDKPEAPKANDTLFKLAENCRRIGGIATKGMLVSYRKLRDSETKLARALHIEVVAGQDISRLPEKLKSWVRPR